MAMPQLEYEIAGPASTGGTPPARTPGRAGATWGDVLVRMATSLLCLLHASAIWVGLGGAEGLGGEWPILSADHGIHYHHGVVSRHFLRESGTTAGYDPSFMSGYAMSIVSDPSSTFSDLVMLAFPGRPAMASKVHVLICSACLPWLVALAARSWGARPVGVALAVGLFLAYFWTDSPANDAALGMLDYLLSVPMGLLAVGALTAYLDRGGFGLWAGAAASCSAAFLVHPTSPMLVGPAGLLAYGVAATRPRGPGRAFPGSRHFGSWAIAPVVLASNVFWWGPGYLLASTKGGSDLAFAPPGSVLGRLGEVFWKEAPAEAVALGLGLVGLAALARRSSVAVAGLGGFLAAGFGWGYVAGFSRSLDPLHPERHAYACYAAACVASGIGLSEVLSRLRSPRLGRLDRWALAGLLLIATRVFGTSVVASVGDRLDFRGEGLRWLAPPDLASIRSRFGPDTFLASRPKPRATWLVDRLRENFRPGGRLLFEETGPSVPGPGDPFGGRHYSPVVPTMTGLEVIGGPHLHSTVTTNFTQFGEGKLFGRADWDRSWFERYARLYRPTAIACWSPRARAFCLANQDVVEVIADDGTLLIGRVRGFEGAAIRGSAKVESGPNRLVVTDARPGPDGLVVLRYHAVPYLVADPPTAIERVSLEDDPVPFVGFRPTGAPVTIRLVLPPR